MDNELTAETLLDRLNAELLDTWAATRAPTCTCRQLAGLYARAGALRAEIIRLEAEMPSKPPRSAMVSPAWPAAEASLCEELR